MTSCVITGRSWTIKVQPDRNEPSIEPFDAGGGSIWRIIVVETITRVYSNVDTPYPQPPFPVI